VYYNRFIYPSLCNGTTGDCYNSSINCNDGNLCTEDSCFGGNCTYTVLPCNSSDPCVISSCSPKGGCIHTNKSCDDLNPCTVDSCGIDGKCIFTPINASYCIACNYTTSCTWEDACNPFVCSNSTCVPREISCDDGNACTDDECVTNTTSKLFQCNYTPIVCTTSDSCYPNVCNSTSGCVIKKIECDDGNECTEDSCVVEGGGSIGLASCLFDPIVYTSDDSCFSATCLNGQKVLTSRTDVCDNSNLCAVGICNGTNTKPVCEYTYKQCEEEDKCAPTKSCNVTTGQCEVTGSLPDCNDLNPCTSDSLICNHTGNSCSNILNTTICDDNNICTVDTCDQHAPDQSSACNHTSIVCTPNICQISLGCDPALGCQFIQKNCSDSSDFCKISTCDPIAGCIEENRVCVNPDSKCFIVGCVSAQGCVSSKRPDFNSQTGKGGILCPLLYDTTAKAAAIGAGAVAGITIAAVIGAAGIAYGGKRGYDYWTSNDTPLGVVEDNPLYIQSGNSADNPIFEQNQS